MRTNCGDTRPRVNREKNPPCKHVYVVGGINEKRRGGGGMGTCVIINITIYVYNTAKFYHNRWSGINKIRCRANENIYIHIKYIQ